MEKIISQIRKWEIASFLFVAAVGTLLHFTYAWSGENVVAGIFSAVSESTWEHLKLLFMPALLFSVVETFMLGKYSNCVLGIKAEAVLLGMALIVISYYTYSGVLGRNIMWVDIALFYIGDLAMTLYSYMRLKKAFFQKQTCGWLWGIVIWIGIFVLFAVFTYTPPELGIFAKP